MPSTLRIVPTQAVTIQTCKFDHLRCKIQWLITRSDATYPDPASGGYKSQDCGRYTPASVISTSYGSNEADLTAAYEQRQCNEYA